MKIILASKSPRRVELMHNLGLTFEIMPSQKEEDMSAKLSLGKLSENLAKQKAEDIYTQTTGDRCVVGSDTMVALGRNIFGKPKNDDDAALMLKKLSGRWHKVYTSLCVIIQNENVKKEYLLHDVCRVKFKKLTDDMIQKYLKVGEHKDKAGAYGMQGYSGAFVEKIDGNYSTVIGLPVHKLYEILYKENLI